VSSDPIPASQDDSLGILLISGDFERAHYAFMLAAAAAAMGRRVTLFATSEGCCALCDDWSSLADSGRDAAMRLRGVAGIGELRDSTRALGIRMIACETGMRVAAIARDALMEGVEVAGLASFLAAAHGQIITL
jgi:peroxiredoxin family protein